MILLGPETANEMILIAVRGGILSLPVRVAVFLLVFPLSASSKVYEIEAFLGRLVANSLADHN